MADDRIYVACNGSGRRIRVLRRWDMRAAVVTIEDGREVRHRWMWEYQLHDSPIRDNGRPWRTGYAPEPASATQGPADAPDVPEPQLAPEKPSDARTARQETP